MLPPLANVIWKKEADLQGVQFSFSYVLVLLSFLVTVSVPISLGTAGGKCSRERWVARSKVGSKGS